MKKHLSVLVLATFIVPSVAFASWWNPASWSVWNLLFGANQNQKSVTVELSTTPSAPTSTPQNGSEGTTTDQNVVTPQQPIVVRNPVAPSGTTICNGTYWNKCPSGETLICPTAGDAYCQVKQETPKTVITPASAPVVSNNSQPVITDEQKLGLGNYLKGRSNILSELNAFFDPLGNRNVQSYQGILSQTVPKIMLVEGEINAIKIPTVSFSDLLVDDQGLLRQYQSDFFHYGLALEYPDPINTPLVALDKLSADYRQLQSSFTKITIEMGKELGLPPL